MAQQQLKRKDPEVLGDKELIVGCGCRRQWHQEKHNIESWEIIVVLFLANTNLTTSDVLC